MREKRSQRQVGSRMIILFSVLCAFLIIVSLIGPESTGVVHRAAGVVMTPIQKGINTFGGWLGSITENFRDAAALREENEELRERVDTLTAENSQLVLDKEELSRLRELVDLSKTYEDYETIGAHVISKDSGNWFSTFTIDRGTQDGVRVDCNVLGGAGLVGIVTDAGPNWAVVRSIIDDNSNVSAMVSATSDTCIIAGNLQLIECLYPIEVAQSGNSRRRGHAHPARRAIHRSSLNCCIKSFFTVHIPSPYCSCFCSCYPPHISNTP